MNIDVAIKLSIIIISFLLILRVFLFFSNQIQQERLRVFERQEIVDNIVGKDVVIGTDTLTVFEYDWDFDKFELSNGQRIPFEVVKKRVVE